MGANFTDREWEVIRLMAEGHNYESLSNQLGIKHDSVKAHYVNISRKLHVNSMREIVVWFYREFW